MSNNFFAQGDEDEGEFQDIPEEVYGQEAPSANVRTARPPAPQIPTMQTREAQNMHDPIQEVYGQEEQEEVYEQEEEDFSSVLTDARFRLEQGRLYEMIMNHNIFDGAEADEKAIKYVTKQMRNFAKEQMEIMLGMRQEVSKIQPLAAEDFPFNDLEVQTLKALASAATKGATTAPEAQQFSGAQAQPKKVGLNTISAKSTQKVAPKFTPKAPRPLAQKPQAPVKRRNEQEIESLILELGITREEYDRQYNAYNSALTKPFSQMSEEEIRERNRQIELRSGKQAKNPSAIPMPSVEQQESLYSTRVPPAASLNASIVNLLLKPKQ